MHLVQNVMPVGQATNRLCICTLLQTITFMLAADNCSPFELGAYDQFSGIFCGHVLFSICKKKVKIPKTKQTPKFPPKSQPTCIQGCTQKNHHLVETFSSSWVWPEVGIYRSKLWYHVQYQDTINTPLDSRETGRLRKLVFLLNLGRELQYRVMGFASLSVFFSLFFLSCSSSFFCLHYLCFHFIFHSYFRSNL